MSRESERSIARGCLVLQLAAGFLTCTLALVSAMNNFTDSPCRPQPDPVTLASTEGSLADFRLV